MRLLFSRDGEPTGELDDAALAELYRPPAPADRAWVRTNFVSTLDGSIQGPDGRSGSINTDSDHRVFAVHRAYADVVLVGAQTVRTEGYRAIELADWQVELRAVEGLAPFPTLVVVTTSLDVDAEVADVDEPHGPVMVVTVTGHADASVAPLRDAGITVEEVDDDRVALGPLIDRLAGSGLPRILCEGGPRLHRELLAAGLVDELSLTLSPTVVGGDLSRSTSGAIIEPPLEFTLQHLLYAAADETVFTSYRRRPRPV